MDLTVNMNQSWLKVNQDKDYPGGEFSGWEKGHLVTYSASDPLVVYKIRVLEGTSGLVEQKREGIAAIIWERDSPGLFIQYMQSSEPLRVYQNVVMFTLNELRLVRKNLVDYEKLVTKCFTAND